MLIDDVLRYIYLVPLIYDVYTPLFAYHYIPGLPNTHYLSPGTYLLSPGTLLLSPITRYLSPIPYLLVPTPLVPISYLLLYTPTSSIP